MALFKAVLRFRGGTWGTTVVSRTILLWAENAGDAFEAAERYITERSDNVPLKIVIEPTTTAGTTGDARDPWGALA